jgi:hypothetical protein
VLASRRVALALFVVLCACDDLSRFSTGTDSVFTGMVVGDEPDSFVRRGFAPATTLQLEFDPHASDVPIAGSITTSPDPITGVRTFDATSLESIAPLQHDLLSEYEFPGGGRVQNYLYVARPLAGPLAGRDVMIFLSLLDDGSAELRVIAGTGDESRGDHFGLFRLHRQAI